MPFLAGLAPALAGGVASAGTGAAINAAIGSGGQKGSGYQAPALNVTQSGGVMNPNAGQMNPQQAAALQQIRAMNPGGMGGNLADQLQGAFAGQNAGPQLVMPTTGQQAMDAANQVQGGLGQQQDLVNALKAQNGIQNQSNVYGQLQDIAAGKGPNPAQAMLNQATGQNVANQAALMAGQRGASANAGLMARQAAQQGGALQQNAAGQGATMQAQQSLGAIGQAGNIANQQVGNLAGQTNAYNQFAQGNQQNILNSLQGQNQVLSGQQGQQTAANSHLAGINAGSQNQLMGGLIGGAAQGIGGALAQGIPSGGGGSGGGGSLGVIPGQNMSGNSFGVNTNFAYAGGKVNSKGVENPKLAAVAPAHRFPSHVRLPPHLHSVARIYHGHKYNVPHFAGGGMAGSQVSMKQGGSVPGKAKMKGDHLENDTVHAKLSPGEVVLPKSVMESKDPVKAAAQFVAAIQKKKGSSSHESDFKKALSSAIQNRKKK